MDSSLGGRFWLVPLAWPGSSVRRPCGVERAGPALVSTAEPLAPHARAEWDCPWEHELSMVPSIDGIAGAVSFLCASHGDRYGGANASRDGVLPLGIAADAARHSTRPALAFLDEAWGAPSPRGSHRSFRVIEGVGRSTLISLRLAAAGSALDGAYVALGSPLPARGDAAAEPMLCDPKAPPQQHSYGRRCTPKAAARLVLLAPPVAPEGRATPGSGRGAWEARATWSLLLPPIHRTVRSWSSRSPQSTQKWAAVCASVRRMAPRDESRSAEVASRRMGAVAAVYETIGYMTRLKTYRRRLRRSQGKCEERGRGPRESCVKPTRAPCNASCVSAAVDAVLTGASELAQNLAARGVLCEARPATHACRVEVLAPWLAQWRSEVVVDVSVGAPPVKASDRALLKEATTHFLSHLMMHGDAGDTKTQLRLRVCLPSAASILNSRVCEPWGELYQQLGGALRDFERPNGRCVSVSLVTVAGWWLRLRRKPPLLSRETWPLLASHLMRLKPPPKYAQTAGPGGTPHNATMQRERIQALLRPKPTVTAQSMARCAFVGSGHDVRCGPRRGAEIDAHDLVLRVNAASRRESLGRNETAAPLASVGITSRVGRRTDYRINCLVGSKPRGPESERCVVSAAWWKQRTNMETFNNVLYPCCEKPMRSSYTTANLARIRRDMPSHSLEWHVGVESGDKYLDLMLSSSGGNALQLAISACRHLNVYGAGLFAESAESDKRYVHYYDSAVGQCLRSPEPDLAIGFMRPPGFQHMLGWRRARLYNEVLLNVLHAFGALRWVQ